MEKDFKKYSLKEKLHEVIFEADTKAGKLFDEILIILILFSILVVMLDSTKTVTEQYGDLLHALEWIFTILFTIEYCLRIYCINKPIRYILSYYGIIDFLSIVPTYVSFFFSGTRYLSVIRILRVLRIFRVLKFVRYISEAKTLTRALKSSWRKITIFVFVVLTLVVILGSLMYLIEGEENGFTSIPLSIYWAIVTLTTVGYGDISPQTGLGQTLAALIMILGYGIIAVPTGIVTAELTQTETRIVSTQACKVCSKEGHDADAKYCKYCGAEL